MLASVALVAGCAPGDAGEGTGRGGTGAIAGDGGTTGVAGTTGSAGTTGDAGTTGSAGSAGGAGTTGDAGTTGGGGSAGTTGAGGAMAGAGGAGASGGSGGSGGTGGRGGATAGSGGAGRGGAGGGGTSGGAGGAAGRGGTGGGAGGVTAPVTVFIASDSTASTYSLTLANKQAGWGQFLADYFTTQVKVSNQAIGGRTSRRFINEGRLTTILNAMKPGDYLMVQFGTNDGNSTATYDDGEPYFVSTTDFQTYMNMYVDGVRGKQGIPILVTPPPRATCTGDSHAFGNGLAGYSMAMKTVAAAKDVALIDLNAATLDYVQMIGCVAAKADFYLVGDGTHFQQNGARLMAGFVADGVVALALPLAAYRLP